MITSKSIYFELKEDNARNREISTDTIFKMKFGKVEKISWHKKTQSKLSEPEITEKDTIFDLVALVSPSRCSKMSFLETRFNEALWTLKFTGSECPLRHPTFIMLKVIQFGQNVF